jgi:hypothetical protein
MNNPFLLWSLQRLPGIFINLAVIYKSPFTVFMLECVLGESFMIGGVKGMEVQHPSKWFKEDYDKTRIHPHRGHSRLLLAGIQAAFSFGWIPADFLWG